ncbi:hypothetical protein KUL42_36010 [Alteromonas sp. KUL42]|nr:hypothetical protein KUL42_36010 [Alteromonas sp. KUL42]
MHYANRYSDSLNQSKKSKNETPTLSDNVRISSLVREKEIHAEKVKPEIRVIWGDYFKAPQLEKFLDSHELVHKINLATSACKLHVDRNKALELLSHVNDLATRF